MNLTKTEQRTLRAVLHGAQDDDDGDDRAYTVALASLYRLTAPAALVRPAALKLVGQSEVAVMANTKSSTVGVWVTRGQLPEPVAHLACGRIWLRADIEAWLAARAANRPSE